MLPSPATPGGDDGRKGYPGGTADVIQEEEAVGNPEVWVTINIKDRQPTRRTSGEENETPEEDAQRNHRDQNRRSRSAEERNAARIGNNKNSEDGHGTGKLNGKAATLQEKRGLSRYGERYKGKGRDDRR
ncbi:hypothetical protein NDU88_007776 [Pleurodeles waltl]|uniref:Uncharacterized protein n=1 Tax=Pleurodeles waltl TaxID=8319 RepID=A0AAV7NVW8_PLEWA|nr:hypothetical protein NDU88_007776 [Pleurodeles waltl]